MAITAGFVEMKILQETWNGKTYYIEAQMTVDPKEVSQRVAETLNSKQKEKEGDKAEQAKTETERRVQELEAQKREIEARKKEMALKQELARLKELEAKELAKQKAIEEVKHIRGWYQPKAFGIGVGLGIHGEVNVSYTRNISPNFGFDIFKLNCGMSSSSDQYDTESMAYGQLLTGLRFATNRFGRNKNTYFYTSLRSGVGYFDYFHHHYSSLSPKTYSGLAFAAELEVGFHFKYFFLGAAINHGIFKVSYTDYHDAKSEMGGFLNHPPFIGLRIGVDIGKRVAY
jgi:hypothetical protein